MSPQALCRAALQPQGRDRLAQWVKDCLTSPVAPVLAPDTDEIVGPDLSMIRLAPDGRFDFAETEYDAGGRIALPSAQPAVIVPFWGPDGDRDFAAILLEGGPVRTWRGSWAMGAGELEEARAEGLPVKLFSHPCAWYLAEGQQPALCVLDWAPARFELAGVPIIAATVEAGQMIRTRLTLSPEIFVRAEGAAA